MVSNELFNLMVKEILENIDEMSRDYNNSAELKILILKKFLTILKLFMV